MSALVLKCLRANMDIGKARLLFLQVGAAFCLSRFLSVPKSILFTGNDATVGDIEIKASKPPWLDWPFKTMTTVAPLVIYVLTNSGLFESSKENVFCDFGECTQDNKDDRSRFLSEMLYYSSLMTINLFSRLTLFNQIDYLEEPASGYRSPILVSQDVSSAISEYDVRRAVAVSNISVFSVYYTIGLLVDADLAHGFSVDGDEMSSDFFERIGIRVIFGFLYSCLIPLFLAHSMPDTSKQHFAIYKPTHREGRWRKQYDIERTNYPDLARILQITNGVSFICNYVLDWMVDSIHVNDIIGLYFGLQFLFNLGINVGISNDKLPMRKSVRS